MFDPIIILSNIPIIFDRDTFRIKKCGSVSSRDKTTTKIGKALTDAKKAAALRAYDGILEKEETLDKEEDVT